MNRRETQLQRGRQLRRDATLAERLLWARLRRRQMFGHHFRRQHRIGPYFVDFACRRAKLAVEVDGSQHQDRRGYDARRDSFLRSQGWAVLRVGNEDVLHNLEGVLSAIASKLDDSASSSARRGSREP